MGDVQPRLFYQVRCHAQGCAALFFIFRPCYRGQRYCSPPCRQQSRRDQRRAANRRHQQSLAGRLDHRDRQEAYRMRRARVFVTDQGSATASVSGSMTRPDPIGPSVRDVVPQRRVCCAVCGRRGTFIDMSKRRE